MRIYIAGPMHGIPEHNYPAFREAAERWRAAGHRVICPPEINDTMHGGDTRREPGFYIWHDMREILDFRTEGIALLDGWHQSRGSNLEAAFFMLCGLPFFSAETMAPMSTPRSVTVMAYEPTL